MLTDVICLVPLLESSSSPSGSVLIDRIGLLKITMLVIMLILVMIMLVLVMSMLILVMTLLRISCDCHVAMILAIVAWLWFWIQLGLSPIAYADLGDGSNYSVIVMWQWFLRGWPDCDSGYNLAYCPPTRWIRPVRHDPRKIEKEKNEKMEHKMLIDQAMRTRAT